MDRRMKGMALVSTVLLLVLLFDPATPAWVPTDRWEPEIQTFEEADRQHPPKPGSILFIGSSSIRLWRSLAQDFPSVQVINRGFGGSEIADSTAFAARIIVPYRPSMIVLYAGDNDLANGRIPKQVLDDFEAFVARVRKDLPKVRIAFISIKPSLARAHLTEKMREANAGIRAYAARQEGVTYIDVFTPMMSQDGKVRGELFVEDGLHLNRAGYELWRSVVGPYLH
jgi:lysophospholipase L1-like esterase